MPDDERESPPPYNACHHLLFLEKFGVRFVFNHHDVTDPAILENYKRRVARFQTALRAPGRTLLFGVCHDWEVMAEDFRTLAAAIDRKGQNTELLIVTVDGQGPARFETPALAALVEEGAHRLLKIRMSSPMRGLDFVDP